MKIRSILVCAFATLLVGCASSLKQPEENVQAIGTRWFTTQEKADEYTCTGVVSFCNVRGRLLDCTCLGQ